MNGRQKSRPGASSSGGFGRIHGQGFTYLELVFVIVIISTLVSMFLVRVLPAIDEAERASVLKLEGQLRSVLTMEAARFVAHGEFSRVRSMVGTNPMKLMMDPPKNYVGERGDGDDAVPRGHWFFVSKSRRLVYRPHEPRSAPWADREFEAPEFEVRLAYNDLDADGRYTSVDGPFYGVRLARMKGFDWLERDTRLKN